MLDIEQKVIRSSVLFQYSKSIHDVVTDNEIIIGFVLYDMSNANKFWVIFEFFDLGFTVGTGQIDPADNTCNPIVLLRQTKHPAIFFDDRLQENTDVAAHIEALGGGSSATVRMIKAFARLDPKVQEHVIQFAKSFSGAPDSIDGETEQAGANDTSND